MISSLTLRHVMPQVFVGAPPEGGPSEVWDIDLTLERGKSYLITAASGRGKTSLCAFLSGLRRDFVGDILLDNRPVASYEPAQLRRESLAVMFQDLRLFPELTAYENVLLRNQLTNYCSDDEIRRMLTQLGLADRMERPCGQLSIGQQQRVAFVRMLCGPADFFILDEPVSHLDDGNSCIMAEMLKDAQTKTGAGVIITSIGRNLPYNYDKTLCL